METNELNKIYEEIKSELPSGSGKKMVGVEAIITILLYHGLKLLIPEIREWIKLGFSAIASQRLRVEKRLKDYALEKGLDYEQAQVVAEKISQKINENNIESIINELHAIK